jgi:predicted transcriptional regulator
MVTYMSTVAEIEAAIETLTPAQQRELADWLAARLIEETPEMLAAIDAGERSLATERGVPIEEVRRNLSRWVESAAPKHNAL